MWRCRWTRWRRGWGGRETGLPMWFWASTRSGDGESTTASRASSHGEDGYRPIHVHRKMFLPTYGVFEEARFADPGREVAAFNSRFGRMGLLVCEEMWHSLPPTILALDGAELILVVSASPARDFPKGLGRSENLARWDALAQGAAMEHGVFVAVCQLVGSEGGKVFLGGSLVVGPDGSILARGPLMEEGLVSVALDGQSIDRARFDAPLLADLQADAPPPATVPGPCRDPGASARRRGSRRMAKSGTEGRLPEATSGWWWGPSAHGRVSTTRRSGSRPGYGAGSEDPGGVHPGGSGEEEGFRRRGAGCFGRGGLGGGPLSGGGGAGAGDGHRVSDSPTPPRAPRAWSMRGWCSRPPGPGARPSTSPPRWTPMSGRWIRSSRIFGGGISPPGSGV